MLLAQCYGFVFPCRSASEDMDQGLQLQIFRFQFQWHDLVIEIYLDIDGKEEDHHLFLWLFQIMEINCNQPFEMFTHIISTSEMVCTQHCAQQLCLRDRYLVLDNDDNNLLLLLERNNIDILYKKNCCLDCFV